MDLISCSNGPTTIHVAIYPRHGPGILRVHSVRVHDADRFLRHLRTWDGLVVIRVSEAEADKLRQLSYKVERVREEVQWALGREVDDGGVS